MSEGGSTVTVRVDRHLPYPVCYPNFHPVPGIDASFSFAIIIADVFLPMLLFHRRT